MNLPIIHISDYDYALEDAKIAKYPLAERSSSKLLYYKAGNIEHAKFKDLPQLLPNNSMLVFNNTKVIEARLNFKKETGSEIEVFLLNPANQENASVVLSSTKGSVWHCMIGNKKRWKQDDVLKLTGNNCSITAHWKDRENNLVHFEYDLPYTLLQTIHELGSLPIPPYLNRPTEELDITRYQTTFAQYNGSVAAPTAALHFDKEMYDALNEKGIKCEYLTLHVGAGTFKPVSAENAIDHEMHEEYIVFNKSFIRSLLNHVGPIIAVGTTSLRSLESLYWFGVKIILQDEPVSSFHIEQYFPYSIGKNTITTHESLSAILHWMDKNGLETLEGTSSIYIIPGYKPKMVNGIVTNFHQPQSTLLLLISALVGNDWKKIYDSALANDYRFLSYGDSSLLLF